MLRVYRVPFSTNVERIALAAAYKGVADRVGRRRSRRSRRARAGQRPAARAGARGRRSRDHRFAGDPALARGALPRAAALASLGAGTRRDGSLRRLVQPHVEAAAERPRGGAREGRARSGPCRAARRCGRGLRRSVRGLLEDRDYLLGELSVGRRGRLSVPQVRGRRHAGRHGSVPPRVCASG